jgi:hypothetical protein
MHVTSALIIDAPDHRTRHIVAGTLARFGTGAMRVAGNAAMRIVVLRPRDRFCDRSRALRRIAAGVDDWPVPPAGLFVVEERTVYLRSCSVMTVAHEFAHALDCALGGGIYISGVDPRVRAAFERATAFITPYAASALDEYFAEALRAWVDANDPNSLWPPATRDRLREIDAPMADYVDDLFATTLAEEL